MSTVINIPNFPDSLHFEPSPLLSRISFVLIEPSHPGNVGSAARAMRVMGLKNLRVVAPRYPNVLNNPQARALSSGAFDVLDRALTFDTLDEALADIQLKIAVSATSREFSAPAKPPSVVCHDVMKSLQTDLETVAFVFGTERTGLSIEQVQRCQWVCSIPGAIDYQSLNLSQAVQIMSYCLGQASEQAKVVPLLDTVAVISKDPGERLSRDDEVEGLLGHLEKTLIDVEFLDPVKPKKLMPRLRRLFMRAGLSKGEVDILRGICTAVQSTASHSKSSHGK